MSCERAVQQPDGLQVETAPQSVTVILCSTSRANRKTQIYFVTSDWKTSSLQAAFSLRSGAHLPSICFPQPNLSVSLLPVHGGFSPTLPYPGFPLHVFLVLLLFSHLYIFVPPSSEVQSPRVSATVLTISLPLTFTSSSHPSLHPFPSIIHESFSEKNRNKNLSAASRPPLLRSTHSAVRSFQTDFTAVCSAGLLTAWVENTVWIYDKDI